MSKPEPASDLPEPASLKISHTEQLQAQALHTVYAALGGVQVYGGEGMPAITIDDTSSMRQNHVFRDADGKWLYTTHVTVSVSRVEMT